MRKMEGRDGDSLDYCRVCPWNSLHVLFDKLAMEILDLLATVPVEVK